MKYHDPCPYCDYKDNPLNEEVCIICGYVYDSKLDSFTLDLSFNNQQSKSSNYQQEKYHDPCPECGYEDNLKNQQYLSQKSLKNANHLIQEL
jgi:ribosomal protein L37E